MSTLTTVHVRLLVDATPLPGVEIVRSASDLRPGGARLVLLDVGGAWFVGSRQGSTVTSCCFIGDREAEQHFELEAARRGLTIGDALSLSA